MTNQQHPITPAPELVQQWEEECESGNNSEVSNTFDALQWFASKAARWGADQELEACCKWLAKPEVALTGKGPADLRDARRPKPPSLKEQAYAALDAYVYGNPDHGDKQNTYNTIRRALEQLDD
jgi:hypothetical protein